MASGISNFYDQALLNYLVGAGSLTPPANIFVALFTTSPGKANSGGVEVSGGSYARVSVTNNGTNWTVASGVATNANQIQFPTATANWGTIVTVAYYTASSAGNLIWFSDLASGQVVNSGITVQYNPGDISLTLN